MDTIEKYIKMFPKKKDVLIAIWKERKKIKTETIPIGKTFGGKDIWFTNDPDLMLMCGATIPSSYSPNSPSFEYLPTLVLQPYIGMIFVEENSDDQMVLNKNGCEVVAPRYKCRAFVMHKDGDIVAKFPTYTSSKSGWDYDLDSFDKNEFAMIESKTPAVQIHLDCMDQYKTKDGHCAIFGNFITPQEYIDNRLKGGMFK